MIDPDALFAALNAAGVDYVVVGGLAASVRGSERLTKDIDIVYHTEAGNVRKLCKVVNALQPRLLVLGEPEGQAVNVTPQTLKQHTLLQLTTTLGEVDLLASIAGFKSYRAIKNASSTVDIEGLNIPVLSLEGVVRSKRAMKRPKDIEDIKQLEAVAEAEAIAQATQD